METDRSRPSSDAARDALDSIDVARRRRLAVIAPPQWLHWSIGMCMVVAGFAYVLVGWQRTVVQVLVLVAIFAFSFAAQRSSGMVTRMARPPTRPLAAWAVFVAIVLGGVYLTDAAARGGQAPLGCFALAAVIVIGGPRLNSLWRRVG